MSRPSTFTQEKAQEICERLSNGEPLAEICRDASMPGYRTVYDWMDAHPEFSANIARARKDGHDSIAAECLRISNTPLIGEEETVKPNGDVEVKRGDMLGHRKLQIETRLKLLAKWDPKRYGERLELAGDPDAPMVTKTSIDVTGLSTQALAELVALRDATDRG
jgi:hypothetical protein